MKILNSITEITGAPQDYWIAKKITVDTDLTLDSNTVLHFVDGGYLEVDNCTLTISTPISPRARNILRPINAGDVKFNGVPEIYTRWWYFDSGDMALPVQAALDSIKDWDWDNLGGGTVKLDSGYYNISTSIEIWTCCTLMGVGSLNTAIEKSTAWTIGPAIVAWGAVKNLRIIGNDMPGCGLHTKGHSGNHHKDLFIQDHAEHGIYHEGGHYTKISDVIIQGSGLDGIHIPHSWEWGNNQCNLRSVVLRNNGRDGLHIVDVDPGNLICSTAMHIGRLSLVANGRYGAYIGARECDFSVHMEGNIEGGIYLGQYTHGLYLRTSIGWSIVGPGADYTGNWIVRVHCGGANLVHKCPEMERMRLRGEEFTGEMEFYSDDLGVDELRILTRSGWKKVVLE